MKYPRNRALRILPALCLFTVFIFLSFSLYAGDLSGQAFKAEYSINVKNRQLSDVLLSISKQTGVEFLFSPEGINSDRKVHYLAEKRSVRQFLEEDLNQFGISYEVISDEKILLHPLAQTPTAKTIDENLQSKAINELIITGKVTTASGEAIPFVSIHEKGKENGAFTRNDGTYSISVSESKAILVFSSVGFVYQEIAADGRTVIDLVLDEDVNEIDEVVVIGYGSVKKRDLTGAVSSVKASDLNLTAATSIGHALQGKAAGLSVIQNSAQPGGGLDVLIRGAGSVNASNRPLYIVDGFPISTPDVIGSNNNKLDAGTQGVLNFLNPNDIASIEILKDASATAIFGSRAANGVVLITTKRGAEGRAIVNFSASYGIQKSTDMYDVLGLKEWMKEKNTASWDLWIYNNRVYPYGTRTLEEAMAMPVNGVAYSMPYTDTQIDNAGEGTDWLSLVTRTGAIKQYNLSLQGGNSGTKYLASGNYYDHQGIIKNSNMRRYTGKFNFDQNISKYVKVSMNLTATRLDNDNTPLGAGQWENSGLIRAAVQMGPHIAAVNENGEYPINPLLPTQPNPYSLLEVTDRTVMDRLLANGSIIVEPIKDLTLKLSAGIDRSHQERNTYMPKSTLHGNLQKGVATINQNNNEQYLSEITANYNFTIGKDNKFAVLAGYSYERFISNGNNAGNNNFTTDGFLWNNLNAGAGNKTVGSYSSENKLVSFFGRVNYTLMDRYLLTLTLRSDGASVFARNHKWGYFPSVAAGWDLSSEKFMLFAKDYLNLLKLRVSYGQTGNSDIGSNAFAAYYPNPAWATLNNERQIGVFPSRLENPNLKWETTTEFNIGLDVSIFKNKIAASFEYYSRVISDLLNMKALNAYNDISFVMANIGKTQSKGFEITLNTKNFTRKNFSWSSDFTFTMYRDKWLERTPDWKPSVYERENDPVRPIYSRIAGSILQAGEQTPISQPDLIPGQIAIHDIDGYVRDTDGNPAVDQFGRFMLTGAPDGTIDDADTRLLGTSDPGFILGLSNSFKFRGFDLAFNIYGMFDRIMEDPTRMAYGVSAYGIAQYGYNELRSTLNRWTPSKPSNSDPSSFFVDSRYGYGNFFYEKAWFIRLQNISIGYTLPKTVLSKVITHLRIHIDANNLLVITPYRGLDPETDSYTAAYPNARTFTAGIEIQF
ncbi:MAG: TonB-dependent receptor [Prevotellaceae bacterium]|nr:TonB-dependent receptor [Prevotellaceae bacterium]